MEQKALAHLKPVEGSHAKVHPAYEGAFPGDVNTTADDCKKGQWLCRQLRRAIAANDPEAFSAISDHVGGAA